MQRGLCRLVVALAEDGIEQGRKGHELLIQCKVRDHFLAHTDAPVVAPLVISFVRHKLENLRQGNIAFASS